MRARGLAIFVLGFAVGALSICLLLWSTGNLKAPTSPGVVQAQPRSPAGPSATEPKPAEPSAAQPQPLVPPPVGQPGHGNADRQQSSLLMPVEGVDVSKLTDTFDELRDGQKHEALDIPAPKGTPVRACAEGNVVKLFNSKKGGLTVYQFDDSQTYCYYYAHLERYAPGLREGTLLRRGDVLGYVDSTGDASADAPHLHFAVFQLGPDKKWWHGTPIDPLPLIK